METTYLEYLNSYRLSRIYRDLIATDLPVGTLAEKHGFTNDKLFHRLFRERFHTTPLQLRKAHARKDPDSFRCFNIFENGSLTR